MLGVMQPNSSALNMSGPPSGVAGGKRKAVDTIDFSAMGGAAKKRKKTANTTANADATKSISTTLDITVPILPAPSLPSPDTSVAAAAAAAPVRSVSFAAPSKPASALPKPASAIPKPKPTHLAKTKSISVELPSGDTPIIERNRAMRAEADKRRKASRSSRGKRASNSMSTGLISQPHPTVPTFLYHKHIKPDLPEAVRAQHVLVWCGSWAAKQAELPTASSSSSSSSSPGPKTTFPKLSATDAQLAKNVQTQILKMLAEGKIDTNVLGRPGRPPVRVQEKEESVKPHKQNVMNSKRKNDFMKGIGRAKDEDGAWAELVQEFKARESVAATSSTAASDRKAKGKGRESVSNWAWDVDLGDRLSNAAATSRQFVQLNRQRRAVDAATARPPSPISSRLQAVDWDSDQLHQKVNVVSAFTQQLHDRLDTIFGNLNATLKARAVPLTEPSAPSNTANMLPSSSSSSSKAVKQDPILLLRGISRMDAQRPDSAVSAPVRRARASMAVAAQEGPVRQYTAVAPTPRRAGTPKRTPRKAKETS